MTITATRGPTRVHRGDVQETGWVRTHRSVDTVALVHSIVVGVGDREPSSLLLE